MPCDVVMTQLPEVDADGKDATAATPLKIATWNVRTLLKKGKLANVIHEMHRHEVNILGVSETHWKNDGDFDSDSVRVIYAGGNYSQRGVALLLDESVAKCVTQVERYKDRILHIKVSAKPVNLSVI